MELIADGLLILAALTASIYCMVLSKRLRRLNQLDAGLGGAIAALSGQVDEMRGALNEAKIVTERSKRELDQRTKRAEAAAGRLEVLLAAVRSADVDTGSAAAKAPEAPATEPLANPEPEETAPESVGAADDAMAPSPMGGSESMADEDDLAPQAPAEFEDDDALAPSAFTGSEDEDAPSGGFASSGDEEDGATSWSSGGSDDEAAQKERFKADPLPDDEEPGRERFVEAEREAAEVREEAADKELKLADAFSDLTSQGETGISKDLLRALEAMAGGGKA